METKFSVAKLNEKGLERFMIKFNTSNKPEDGKGVYIDLCSHIILFEEVDHFWIIWFSAPQTTNPREFFENPKKFKTICHTFNGKKGEEDKEDVLLPIYQDLQLEAKFSSSKLHLVFTQTELEDVLLKKVGLDEASVGNVKQYLIRNKSF